MKPTPQQIVDRIEKVKDEDIFGVEVSDLLSAISFQFARPYLKDEVTENEWEASRNRAAPREQAINYLPFAWDKANNNHGLSANRSICHLRAFLWLDGLVSAADWLFDDYEFYGKPQLVFVSELYGFDWKAHDDGRWTNDESDDGISPGSRDKLINEMQAKAKTFTESPDDLNLRSEEGSA